MAKLQALEPPAAERAALDEMIAGFERGLSRGAAIASASRRGDFPALRRQVDAANSEFSGARAIAAREGLDACVRLGRVDR